jgi:DnaJ-class molecular chaperone
MGFSGEPCRFCEGSGLVFGKVCPICKGEKISYHRDPEVEDHDVAFEKCEPVEEGENG